MAHCIPAFVSRLALPAFLAVSTLLAPSAYADRIAITGGNNQTRVVGTQLPTALAVRVTTNAGLARSGATVTFAVLSGGGAVTPVTAVTNALGNASTRLTLGTVAGANTVRATAPNAGNVTFSATGTPAAASKLALSPASSSILVNNAVSYQATVQDTFGNRVTSATNAVTFSASGVSGNFSPGSTVAAAAGRANVSFTPTSAAAATITAAATGLTSASASLTVNAPPPPPPPPPPSAQTVFTTQVPASPDITDGVAYELGMKFQAGRSGQVTAIRYWKAASDGGSHVGTIWSTAGAPLASVTFTGETASGWQQQALATPVAIQPNTTYVVSVTANSNFADTNGGLASAIVNGDLSSVADGSNGVFGSPGAYPTGSWQNSNYFRDVVFIADAAPTISKVGGDNQSGSVGTTLANSLVVQVKNASGNPQSGTTVTFGVTAGGGTVSPASAVTDSGGLASTSLTLGNAAGTNTVHASASGIGSVDFNATASVPTQASGQTIFTTQVPAATDTADGVTYELGMKFRTARAGQIVALRHWKSPSETGTHVGRIWSANGSTADERDVSGRDGLGLADAESLHAATHTGQHDLRRFGQRGEPLSVHRQRVGSFDRQRRLELGSGRQQWRLRD